MKTEKEVKDINHMLIDLGINKRDLSNITGKHYSNVLRQLNPKNDNWGWLKFALWVWRRMSERLDALRSEIKQTK